MGFWTCWSKCWNASRRLYFWFGMWCCLKCFYTFWPGCSDVSQGFILLFCQRLGCRDNCLFPLQTATKQHWSRLVRLTGGVMWLSDYLDETPAPAHPGPRWETEGSHSERSISISTGMLLPPSSSMRPKMRALGNHFYLSVLRSCFRTRGQRVHPCGRGNSTISDA